MASNVQLDVGTGGAIAASAQITHDGDTAQLQLVGLMGISGTEDAYTAAKINGDATNGIDVDVTRLPALPAGTNNIGDIDVLSVVPGTAATNLGKAEDAAHASGDVGVMALTVRQDVAAALGGLDADYQPLISDASGRLHVNVGALPAIPAGTNNIGDVDVLTLPALPAGTNNIGDVDVLTLPALPAGTNNIGDVDVLSVPAPLNVTGGGVELGALRVTLANDSTGLLSIDDNGGSITVDGTVTANLAAGTNNIGDVDVLSIAAGDNNIGNVDVVTLPNVTLAAGTNTNEVVGDAAHDAAVAGNPVLVGVEARSSDGTAVANGDVVRLIATLLGKQVTYPYALPGLDWHYAAASGGIVNTTGVTAKTAAGAGIRNYVTRAEIINGHATVSTDVQIRDGAAGTVLWRGFAQAAGGGVAAKFDPPLRGTANTLIEIACGTTGSAVYVNLHGFVAAE